MGLRPNNRSSLDQEQMDESSTLDGAIMEIEEDSPDLVQIKNEVFFLTLHRSTSGLTSQYRMAR